MEKQKSLYFWENVGSCGGSQLICDNNGHSMLNILEPIVFPIWIKLNTYIILTNLSQQIVNFGSGEGN